MLKRVAVLLRAFIKHNVTVDFRVKNTVEYRGRAAPVVPTDSSKLVGQKILRN